MKPKLEKIEKLQTTKKQNEQKCRDTEDQIENWFKNHSSLYCPWIQEKINAAKTPKYLPIKQIINREKFPTTWNVYVLCLTLSTVKRGRHRKDTPKLVDGILIHNSLCIEVSKIFMYSLNKTNWY